MRWKVEPQESGLKLLKFLKAKLPNYSLKQLKRFLEENLCTVNGETERFATVTVVSGDLITFKLAEETGKQDLKLAFDRILYEDEELLIYDKPSGIASDAFKSEHQLIHRLDKETTGVLMFAKTENMRSAMIDLFRGHLVHKTYLAIVDGTPKKNLIRN